MSIKMTDKLGEILKLIGWTDGYHIPVLNEDNETLSKKVEGILKEKATYMIQLEDLTNRVNAIEKHIKDVDLHRKQMQDLIYSCRKCKESEDHMIKVATRDEEKIKQDIQKFSRLNNESYQRNDSLECEIKQLRQGIETMKKEADFDRETLELWEEEILQKEKENEIIECYSHEDDLKAKEQNRQLEKLQIEAISKQQKMDKLNCDIQSQELTLEHICSLYRKMHVNRQYLIQQWESCIAFMGKRDEEIAISRHELNELQKTSLQQRELLLEEERFLEGLQRNNRETEIKTQNFNREAAILSKKRDQAAFIFDQLVTEISNVRRTLANTEKQAERERCAQKHLVKECLELEERVEQMKRSLAKLERRLVHVKSHQMTSEERATQLEDILEVEETRMKEIDAELKNIQGNIFRHQCHLQELKEAETTHLVTIRGIESTIKLLTNKRHTITREHMQKSQLEYHLDFLMQKLETRIARMMGKEQSDKQEELNKKIENLEKALSEKNAEKRFLTSQKTKLEDEERRLQMALESNREELKNLTSSKAEESNMVYLNGRVLEERRAQNQNLLVDESILRLKTSKADSMLAQEGRRVFSLEKERLEIDTALKERRLEINMEREVLEAKRRAVSDEVSLLNLEVKHMQSKISQLQKRYEIATVYFASDEEASDEPMSLIRFNLKIAQEKQELQEEGDKLERQIQRAEKEIRAMETTLRLVGCTNDAYKRSLCATDADSPDVMEKRNLELELQEALDLRRQKNLTLMELQNELSARTTAMGELDAQIGEMEGALKEEVLLASGLVAEIEEQHQKQGRADLQTKRLQVDLRRQAGGTAASEPTFDERDYSVRQLNVATKRGLNLLVQLIITDPEMAPRAEQLLEEKGLLKPFREARSLYQGSREVLGLRSSMTIMSPKLMPPANTPTMSLGGVLASPLGSHRSLTTPKTAASHSSTDSAVSPSTFTIDGTLFSQAQGRTSGTHKGAVSRSRVTKRDSKK